MSIERPRRLDAGGTLLPRPDAAERPRLARLAWLWVEFIVVFIGTPLLLAWLIFEQRLPLFVALQPVLLLFIGYMLYDDTFHLKAELSKDFTFVHLLSILAVFVIVAAVVAWLVQKHMPGQYLAFPRRRTRVYQLVMIAYPLLSVVTQELVFRTFFFHRYGPLFGRQRVLAVLVNGAAFGFAHIIFGNWVAVAGTAALGTLLAWRYTATHAFWAVWLEHTLYGWLVFTVGLGGFFFTGVASVG
ncbi:MAG: CPBP family intramembrane glutamic endopeptidase [Hyphomicrobiaceae bacterium]